MTKKSSAVNDDATDTSDREISETRILNAPRDLVWKAWTDPRHIAQWWGPNGFTNRISKMEVKPGGVWEFVMHGPDGIDYQNKIFYVEIVKPEVIVYKHVSGPRFLVTVTFTEQGDKTLLAMRMLFETAELRDLTAKKFKAVEGLSQTLARLEDHVTKARDFVITRVLNAPREVVYRAWTDPERMKQWFGPNGLKTIRCAMDLRPGGVYHYGMAAPDGKEIWGKWIFREILPPERLVFVQSFSDKDLGVTRHPMNQNWPLETLSTILFEEKGGKTLLAVKWSAINATEAEHKVFDSSHDSMYAGWGGTLDKLAAFLKEDK